MPTHTEIIAPLRIIIPSGIANDEAAKAPIAAVAIVVEAYIAPILIPILIIPPPTSLLTLATEAYFSHPAIIPLAIERPKQIPVATLDKAPCNSVISSSLIKFHKSVNFKQATALE